MGEMCEMCEAEHRMLLPVVVVVQVNHGLLTFSIFES